MCQDGLKILRKISFIGTFFKNTEIRNTHKENTYSKLQQRTFTSLSSILTEGMQYIRHCFPFTKRNKLTVPEGGSFTFRLIKE